MMKHKIAALSVSLASVAGVGIGMASSSSADGFATATHAPMMNFTTKADCQAKATAFDKTVKSKGLALAYGPTVCELNDKGWSYFTGYVNPKNPEAAPSSYALSKADSDNSGLNWYVNQSHTNFKHEYGGFPTKAACDSTFQSVWDKVAANPNTAEVVKWDAASNFGSMACYKESGKTTYRYRVVYHGQWLKNLYDYEQFRHFDGTDTWGSDGPHEGSYGTMMPNKVVQLSKTPIAGL